MGNPSHLHILRSGPRHHVYRTAEARTAPRGSRLSPGARLHRAAAALLLAALLSPEPGQATEDPPVQVSRSSNEVHIGAPRFRSNNDIVLIATPDAPDLKVEIQAGGTEWPWMRFDDDGHLDVGATRIHLASGRRSQSPAGPGSVGIGHGVYLVPSTTDLSFELRFDARHRCRFSAKQVGYASDRGEAEVAATELLPRKAIQLVASGGGVVVGLTRAFTEQQGVHYTAFRLTRKGCRLTRTPLGNPDLLVELGHSAKGGWWIVGSIETTLLRSMDGRRWTRHSLFNEVGGLVSAHAASERDIWLAAYRAIDLHDSVKIVRTVDGGRSWRELARNDPQLHALPRHWYEGQLRAHGRTIACRPDEKEKCEASR